MKEFKVKFSADVNDLMSQFKKGSKELEQFVNGVAQAENKLEALSQTGEYLAQMDSQLSKLAKKYPNVFNEIFGSVDADIKKALAPILRTPELLSKSLSKIGEQLEGVLSGKIESEAIKINQLGKEVKVVTKALGAEVDLKFLDGSSKEENKAKKLINVLAKLEKQYTSLGQLTSGKYVTTPKRKKETEEPKASQSKETLPQMPDINTSKAGDKLKEENDKVKTQLDALEAQKKRYNEIIAALEGEDIKITTKKSTDVNQLKELVAQFDEATAVVKKLETSKLTSGDEYKKALGEQYRLATLVKNTMDEVAEEGSNKGAKYVANETGELGAYGRAEDILDGLKASTAQEIKAVFADLLSSMNNVGAAAESGFAKVEGASQQATTTLDEQILKAQTLKELYASLMKEEYNFRNGQSDGKEYLAMLGKNGLIGVGTSGGKELTRDTVQSMLSKGAASGSIMSLHNHPNGMDMPSVSDLLTWAQDFVNMGVKINGIITSSGITAIDFSDIDSNGIQKIIEKYKLIIQQDEQLNNFLDTSGELKWNDKVKNKIQNDPKYAENFAKMEPQIRASISGTLREALNQALQEVGAKPLMDFYGENMAQDLEKYLGDTASIGVDSSKIKEEAAARTENAAAAKAEAEAIKESAVAKQALADFQTLAGDVQSSLMTGAMDSEAVGKYSAQIEAAKTQLQEFANQGLITAEQMEKVNATYTEALSQINSSREANNAELTALKARPEKEGEPLGSYDSGFDDGYSQGQASKDNEIDSLQQQLNDAKAELAKVQQSVVSGETESVSGANLETLQTQITAITEAVQAKTGAFKEEAQIVGATVAQEVNELNNLLSKVNEVKDAVRAKTQEFVTEGQVAGQTVGKEVSALIKLKATLDQISTILAQQIAAYQQIQQWSLTNTSNNTPSNGGNNNSSSSNRSSSNVEALKLLREEENLKVRIFNLEQKGANDADLQHLREKIALYESLRGAIEDAMPDDVYRDYQTSAMSVEDLGDTKLTIAQINADIQDRNNLEKDALTLLKEEYKLRNQISLLEKDGATTQELNVLKQRADLYANIRGNVEQVMTSEQLLNYGTKAIDIQGKNNEKLTVNDIKSNIKERVASEKAAYSNLLRLQKEYAEAQKDLEKTPDGQQRDEIFNRALQAEEAYNNQKKQTNLTQEQTNELLQNELKLQQELKEIRAANADKEQKAANKKQTADDAKRIAEAAKAQKAAAAEANRVAIATQNAQLSGYKNDLSKRFTSTKLDRDTATDEQKILIQEYDKLIQKIQDYSIARQQMSQAEKTALEAEIDGIKQKLNAYTKLNETKLFTKGFERTTNKKDSLSAIATSSDFADSQIVQKQLSQMIDAYERFKAKKNEIDNMTTAPSDIDKDTYYQLSDKYTQAAKALEQLIAQSRKLEQIGTGNVWDVDSNRFKDNAEALKFAVEQFHGKNAIIGKFSSDMKELSYQVKNSDGTLSSFTAVLDSTGTKIVEVSSKTKAAQGAFGKFFDSIRLKFKDAIKVFSGYNLFFQIINQVRQGVQYVKEIDSALTELKKVTDETDASYARFLQTMSKTGAEIGATVSDLTNMAASWARLGYSMEEAGELAKSTAVLLNVSEFDNAEDASEALISTMQAYGYAAEESMHVVDVLNEIGKIIACR